MKKLVILYFSLLVISIQIIHGQIAIGVKGGYTNSWPGYGDVELPNDAQTHISGNNLSIFLTIPVFENYKITFNPGYIKRGAACFPGWQPVFEGDSKVLLNYFELPILIEKGFSLGSTKLDLVSGLGYGLSSLNSANVHEDRVFQDGINTIVSPIRIGKSSNDIFNRIDHGFYLNLKVVYNLFINHFIFLDTQYYHGMRDYDKVNVSKNRSINLNFGFGYRI